MNLDEQKEGSMEFLVALYLAFLLFLCFVFFKNVYNPAVIFTGFWLIIFILYAFHLYGLYHMSDEAIFLFVLGITFYDIGCLLMKQIKIKQKSKKYSLNETRIKFLFYISFVILLVQVISNLSLLRGGLSAVAIRYSTTIEKSYLLTVLQNFVAIPISVCFIAIFFSNIIYSNKNKKIAFYAIILIFLDLLAVFETMGIYLFAAGVIFLILYSISINGVDYVRKIKNSLKKMSKVLIIGVFSLVSLRSISLFKHLYIYLTGSLVCFSEKLADFHTETFNLVGMKTYGVASIQGILRPFVGALEQFGFSSKVFDSADIFYWPWLGVPLAIGSTETTSSFNYFTTPFLFFFKDLGITGVMLFSLLYGLLCTYFYRKLRVSHSLYYTTIYIFIIFSIFMTLMEAPFVRQTFAMAILYIIFTRRKYDTRGDSYI